MEHIRLHRWKSNIQEGLLEIFAVKQPQLLCSLQAVKTSIIPIGVEVTDNVHQRLHRRWRLRLIPVLNQRASRRKRRAVTEALEIKKVKTLCKLTGRPLQDLHWGWDAAIARFKLANGRWKFQKRPQQLQIPLQGFLPGSNNNISYGIGQGLQPVTGGLEVGNPRSHLRQQAATVVKRGGLLLEKRCTASSPGK